MIKNNIAKVNATITTIAGHTDNYSNVTVDISTTFVIVRLSNGRTTYYPISNIERMTVGET